MISSIIQAPLKNNIQPNISEQEKKRKRIYDLLNAKVSLSTVYKVNIFQEKEIFKEKWGSGRLNKKTKTGLFNGSRCGD